MDLKALLINEYNKRGFEESLTDYEITETEMKLFIITENKRSYLGTCKTLNEARNLMYDFYEERGFKEICYKSLEENNVVKFIIDHVDESFELELEPPPPWQPSKLFGSALHYRGRKYILGGVPGRKSFFDNAFCVPVNYSCDKIKISCEKIYRDLAKRDLTAKVEVHALHMGIEVPDIKINGAKGNLSSYTGGNTVNFSWRIIMGDDNIYISAYYRKGKYSQVLGYYRQCFTRL